jgi:hypothetical protein
MLRYTYMADLVLTYFPFKNVFGVLTATQPCFLSPIPRHMHGKPDYLQKSGHVMTQSK